MKRFSGEIRQKEEADTFLARCRGVATGRRDRLFASFAPALLDYARRPLPEGLNVWLDTPLEISTASEAFLTVHQALHALLSRYVELKLAQRARRERPPSLGTRDPEWMALVAPAEAAEAFAPFLSPEEARGLWLALGEAFNAYWNVFSDSVELRAFMFPPSPFQLALVVDLLSPDAGHPALFALRLPNGALQPLGDWIREHWQEGDRLHALADQWNVMAAVCFGRLWKRPPFCEPFLVDEELMHLLYSEGISRELAWFNCTLCGRMLKRVGSSDVAVRGKLGERRLSGEFNAQALLDFSYELVIDGQRLSNKDLERLLKADPWEDFRLGERILPATLVDELCHQLQQLRQLETARSGKALSFFEGLRLLAGLPVRQFDNDGAVPSQFQPSERLATFLAGGDPPPMPALPEATAQLLRPYQREGVRFLWEGTARGLGLCLADDMGLGKTLQLLALLQLWQRAGTLSESPAVIIVPPSLLENWRTEQRRWAPELTLRICHPKWMSEAAWQRLEEDPGEALRGVEVALFSYQIVPRLPKLAQLTFPAIVLDEAQAIKNPDALQSQAVRRLNGARRIILTGTPVENSLLDLWTLFDFLNPGLLGPQERIRKMNRDPERAMPALRRLVKPFLLRRQKGDPGILEELPGKDERLVPCLLTPTQAIAYKRDVEALRVGLEMAQGSFARGGLVLRTLVRLKQICNHPSQRTHATDYPPEASGKFQTLLTLAREITGAGEKFLLFTQFYEIIAPLHALLTERLGCPGFILNGSTPVEVRKTRVEAFQTHQGPAFFIISLRAGGVGLNLTAAAHVIHFDRWWNPAVENQASDRAHRFGQQHRVTIHKFICHGTLEERIDALIEQKRALSDELLRAGPERLLTAMSNDELLDLVRLEPAASEALQ